MSSPIVTLPTTVASGLQYFPASAFAGLKLDVGRNVSFENTVSRAASGREVAVSWREMPTIVFDLAWNFVDANPNTTPPSTDGSPTYTELDRLVGFFAAQHGGLLPFYLRLADLTQNPADSQVLGQQIAVGDGVTTNFQLCRQVGNYLEPIQMVDPASVPVMYLNGTVVFTWTLLPKGIIQFSGAPGLGVSVSADFGWVYLAKFDADEMDVDQFALLMHECKSLKLRTVIQ